MSITSWARFLAPALLLLIVAPPAHAESRITWPIYGPTQDCSRPSVASSQPLFSVTAWEQAGSGIWTAFEGFACAGLPGGTRQALHAHGAGERPTVGVLLDETYILAFVRGDSLVVREGDGQIDWTTVAVTYLGDASAGVGRIDMWCSTYYMLEDLAWLAVWTGQYQGGGIRFMRRSAAGWEPIETVPGTDSELVELSHPQVTEFGDLGSPQPRIYFNDMNPGLCLKSVDWYFGGGWAPPVVHDAAGAFGGAFDVARTQEGYVFLSTGLQPPCPCNSVHFTEWTEWWGWSIPLDLTAGLEFYDWPFSPQIGVDGDRVHAFWFQLGSDEMMEPRSRRLFYHVREAGIWEDRSLDLAEQWDRDLDDHLSMSIDSHGGAVLAWARRDAPEPKRIWISYPDYCGGDVEDGPPAAPRLSAFPNPFNPSLTITASGEHDVVALEIFDAGGRLVRRLQPSLVTHRWTAQWDGCDVSGQELASGTYVLRMRAGTGAEASRKITLAR